MDIKYSIENGKFVKYNGSNKLFWIEMINPTREEIEEISEEYNLPKDYIFDINDPQEVPRVEGLEDETPNLFLLNYPIKLDEVTYSTRPISIIVTDEVVITVRKEDSMAFDNFSMGDFYKVEVTENMEDFVIELAWRISQSFIKYVKTINIQIDRLEESIKKSTKTELFYQIINIQKSLISFQVAIRENGPVMGTLYESEKLFKDGYSKYSAGLIHDLQVEMKQASVMIEKATVMIESMSDLYSNVISNNLNSAMKILTSITIIMTVPTILGGLWGMNMKLPFEKSPNAFWYIIIATLVISWIIMYFLKKRDYL